MWVRKNTNKKARINTTGSNDGSSVSTETTNTGENRGRRRRTEEKQCTEGTLMTREDKRQSNTSRQEKEKTSRNTDKETRTMNHNNQRDMQWIIISIKEKTRNNMATRSNNNTNSQDTSAHSQDTSHSIVMLRGRNVIMVLECWGRAPRGHVDTDVSTGHTRGA